MFNQESQIPSTSSKKLTFTGVPFSNPLTVKLPGTTIEKQKVVLELLEKNHKEFSIYFDDKGYHNHFVHHVLAAYSMGASIELLREIFTDNYATYLRPMPPSKVKITRENWTEYLGRMDLWTDYLEFFDNVVKEDGMEKAFNEYGFHPKLFPHFTAGVFHSAIHIGYGVEFQIPLVLSEGLAQAAVHPNEFEKVLDEDFFKPEETEKKSIMDIVKSSVTDNRFDVIVYSEKQKRKKLLAEAGDALRELAKSWVVVPTEQGIKEATRELYEACITFYGSTALRPDKETTHLDFFLVHGLTAMLLTFAMLPYVTPDKQRMLLKAHFTGVLTEYIAQGRPELHIDYLNSYTPKNKIDIPNPWMEITTRSLIEDDSHVIKAVRALMKAEEEWPPVGKDNIYLKLAQVTCEGYKATGWGRDVGFEEQWKEGQAKRIRMGKNVFIQ